MAVSFRRLQVDDYQKGFLRLLSQLSTVGNVSKEKFEALFKKRENNPLYHTFVAERDGKIICSATLLIEDKYLHECSPAGHIEDVVVDESYRRTGLGKKLIEHLIKEARANGCYKVILDCEDKNIPFYQSCNLSKHGNEMSIYL